MRSEAGFGSAAVRYASVGNELVPRTGAEKPTDGGWERLRRPSARLCAFDLGFQDGLGAKYGLAKLGFQKRDGVQIVGRGHEALDHRVVVLTPVILGA